MENNLDFNNQFVTDSSAVSKSFVSNVFSYMALALGLSGVAAFLFGTTELSNLLHEGSRMTPLGWIVMIAPFAFILLINFGINRLSIPALMVAFIAYSVVMGMSLSFIFQVYDFGVITQVFFITAAVFGVMAVIGYFTKTDLTNFGGILMMALFGMIIASLVNFFMHSESMEYLISCIGVLVFTGLTAYDVQKIKRIGAGIEYGTAPATKLAILGALSLYLDFVNLFLFLLRIFGGRRD